MKSSRKSIETFLEPKKMAITGVSRNPKKFGYQVYNSLKLKGYEVYPVNPMSTEINGERCYQNISELPSHISSLLILNSKENTRSIVKDAITKGINNIWIQQMSDTPEAIELASSGNVNLVHGECIFMFAEKVEGFHKCHRGVKKFFGALPK
jgi:uncharacterized protein